jgi:hypothetical protein
MAQTFLRTDRRLLMRRLIISALATVALLAAATTMLRSHARVTDGPALAAGMVSLEALHSAADVNKLPVEDFEDQSLVYSTKR